MSGIPRLTGSSITLLLVRLSSEILLVTSTINILPPFLMMHMWDSYEIVEEGSPAPCARRFTIRSLSTLRKSGDFFSSRIPTAARYASALWCAGTSWRLPPFSWSRIHHRFPVLVIIFDAHVDHGRDARERVAHKADKRTVCKVGSVRRQPDT